jgi:biopolymer transport protein ExbD
MGRAKLPRKSTSIDMTAMCDVAFLLLSFFILATKPKPPAIVSIVTPSSISNKPVEAKDQVLVNIDKSGKVFLEISDKDKKRDIVANLNDRLKLGLTTADLDKAKSADYFGTSETSLQKYLESPPEARDASLLSGIPAQDSTNNQLKDWLESVNVVYTGSEMHLLVKGDEMAKYPVFKNVIDAFKKNDMMKFEIITSQQGVDPTTDYYKERMSTGKAPQ